MSILTYAFPSSMPATTYPPLTSLCPVYAQAKFTNSSKKRRDEDGRGRGEGRREDRKEEETESGPRIQKAKVSPQVTGQSERGRCRVRGMGEATERELGGTGESPPSEGEGRGWGRRAPVLVSGRC